MNKINMAHSKGKKTSSNQAIHLLAGIAHIKGNQRITIFESKKAHANRKNEVTLFSKYIHTFLNRNNEERTTTFVKATAEGLNYNEVAQFIF